ncbi:MAG: sensor histidine kinase [Candidatus Saccharicenans sp.]
MKLFTNWRRGESGRARLCCGLASALLLLAAVFFLLHSWLLKKYATATEDQVRLELRNRASDIRREFSEVLQQNLNNLTAAGKEIGPAADRQVFYLLKKIRLNSEVDGLAWLDQDFKLLLWVGKVADLEPHAPVWKQNADSIFSESFLFRDHASYYLVCLKKIRQDRILASFKLLAFRPQFQSSYLKEFQLLPAAARAGADINFWEYTADVQSLENLFSRHRDEYFSPQREERESRSLYFPLRNEKGRILATVTLNSIQLWGKKADSFQRLKLLFLLCLALALFFLMEAAFQSALRNSKPGRIILAVLCFAGLVIIRVILIFMSEIKPLVGLKIFSPEVAAFFSSTKLFKSPTDIFLTVFLVAVFFYRLRKIFPPPAAAQPTKETGRLEKISNGLVKVFLTSLVSAFSFMAVAGLTAETVANSNLNLTSFSFSFSALILYLSLFFLSLTVVYYIIEPLVTGCFLLSSRFLVNYLIYLAGGLPFYLLLTTKFYSPPGMVFQLLLWAIIPLVMTRIKPGLSLYLCLLFLMSFLQFYIIQTETVNKTQQLTENVLAHQVISQKSWAEMALKQSWAELQKKTREIAGFLQKPEDRNFARYLWDRTIISRFNWNSCLYLQDAEKKVVSSFSLNLPLFPEQTDHLPFSPTVDFQEFFLEIMGREKHFLVGYQDFGSPQAPAGRLVVWLSLDPELLPFYHSANPYFELLRLNTLPSLQHFPVDLIVYSPKGQILHNTSGLYLPYPGINPEKNGSDLSGKWLNLKSKGGLLRGYALLLDDGNTYIFFYRAASIRTLITTFFKVFFLYLVFFSVYLFLHLIKTKSWLKLARTFSARVYIAFFAATLVPLFLFIFFTQNMVQKIFSDRFVQEATSRAYFARSILDDFISLQEQSTNRSPEISQDLVLWISNTLNNDVNLYKNGRYLSSSRAEFFETGIMPQLLDGETYYRLTYLNEPLTVNRRTIGAFSYQTLTIPFHYQEDTYFLSLPFPLERQEISQTMKEVVEFILFSSFFLMLLIALFARTIKRMIIVPIDKLIWATREVSLGRLDVRVEHEAQDELQHLVDGFNSMVDSLKAHEKELAEMSQKLAWTEMARKVAHEIKNPLTPIQLSAEHILRVYKDNHPEFGRILQESISYIISEVENLRRIAQDFMALAREAGEGKEAVDLSSVIETLLAPFINTLKDKITFSVVKEGKNFLVFGSTGKIKVAIRNVLINAIEAIKEKGRVEIFLKEKPSEIELEIKDSGVGIPPEIIERIFEPYFSTKTGGTGLGLAICRKILEEHEGRILVESQPGQGTKVTMVFPKLKDDQH